MNEEARVHDIILKGRGHMEVSGVVNVTSFDEETVCLETVMGDMMIEGEGLRVSTLDTEKQKIILCGKVNGLYYYSGGGSERKKGFFGRLGG